MAFDAACQGDRKKRPYPRVTRSVSEGRVRSRITPRSRFFFLIANPS